MDYGFSYFMEGDLLLPKLFLLLCSSTECAYAGCLSSGSTEYSSQSLYGFLDSRRPLIRQRSPLSTYISFLFGVGILSSSFSLFDKKCMMDTDFPFKESN